MALRQSKSRPATTGYASNYAPCIEGVLQALLHVTVRALQEAIPGLGETVAFDVKHT